MVSLLKNAHALVFSNRDLNVHWDACVSLKLKMEFSDRDNWGMTACYGRVDNAPLTDRKIGF